VAKNAPMPFFFNRVESQKTESAAPSRHLYGHMEQRRLVSITFVFLFFAFLVNGHAILLTATPAIGQVVRGPDVEVSLRFNSRVDAKRSTIVLVPASAPARTIALGEQSSPDSLHAQIHELESGSYTLQWQVLAVDGHISRGELRFRVE